VIGIRNGTLTFNDDAPTNPQKVALTGTGTQISLSPVLLNFGTVAVSTTLEEGVARSACSSSQLPRERVKLLSE
jgi:hypothetical protein